MDTLYRILLAAHGLSGLVALVTFWTAAAAKKGSPLHLRVGKVYMLAMIAIILTAMPMAAIIAARGHVQNAVFLAYLVVITANGVWLGWRAVKRKRDQAGFRSPAYTAMALATLASAATVFVVGQRVGSPLLMGFSSVGAFTGLQMLIRRARPLASARWWLKEHFSAMIGCGVATHIAFLSIGLDRLIRAFGIDPPGGYHLIAWFLPLVLALIAGVWLNRKYYVAKPVARTAAAASA